MSKQNRGGMHMIPAGFPTGKIGKTYFHISQTFHLCAEDLTEEIPSHLKERTEEQERRQSIVHKGNLAAMQL
jgi:hypothetical protein